MSETMTELKPAAWFFRWPGSTSWRNSDVDPTGRIPNEQFATVLCAYDHEDIAAALSAAEARGREAERERCIRATVAVSRDGGDAATCLTIAEELRCPDVETARAAAIRKGLTP